ncbi:SDH3 [Auxenochlorella protothecoides x Auxenochlorella symbiontica]
MSRVQAFRSLQGLCSAQMRQQGQGLAAIGMQHAREYASVPEFWGRESTYHPGTDFLGTPKNHLDLVAKRPLSPDVMEIDHKQLHYKMPPGAISSITNRATGVMLSLGSGLTGYLALTGALPGAVEALTAAPLLLYPAKALIAWPLLYHYGGGVRHLYWDEYKYGIQVDKTSPLEVPAVTASSRGLLYGSIAASVLLAAVSL